MGTAIKHPVPDWVKSPITECPDAKNYKWRVAIYKFSHPGTLSLSLERQSAQMSKIANDGLTRSDTGCFIGVPIWQQWASKG